MKFIVQIGKETVEFEKFNDMIDYIQSSLAYWNNFIKPDMVHQMTIYKVKSDTPTLGIKVDEKIDTNDLFGQG